MASRPISPAEPAKRHPPVHIQPNAHPYAIKTTSSALLSRSNSSPHSAHYSRHHYVPSAPPRIPAGSRVRHRHSSSLSSVEPEVHRGVHIIPAPFPPPPSAVAVASAGGTSKCIDEQTPMRWTVTLNSATEPMPQSFDHSPKDNRSDESGTKYYAGLPPNPKQWNTDELTAYLESSLESGNVDTDSGDSSVADLLEYVRIRGLTGRELLRLTEADLARTSLSDAQRARLLERSRTLRADVLRGRIYVDSYHAHQVSDNSNDIYSRAARSRSCTPFNSIRGASVSADDLCLLLNDEPEEGGNALSPSPSASLHRSHSVSGAPAERYRDLARMRMRRRGRVRGLVETWERASTSESESSAGEDGSASASDVESESEPDPEVQSPSDAERLSQPPADLRSDIYNEPSQDISSPTVNSTAALQGATPPPPYTHVCAVSSVHEDEEEPSIEELLASSSNTPLRGARAWEADFGLGETAKRITAYVSEDAGSVDPLAIEPEASRQAKPDILRPLCNSSRQKGPGVPKGTGSRGRSVKPQRRVVTAIFTGSTSDDMSEKAVEDRACLADLHASDTTTRDTSACSGVQDDSDSTLRALEESIAATRAQIEVFRVRLEQVEADTARQEAMLMRTQASEFELRRRHLSAGDWKAVEQPSDLMHIEGARNRDWLEVWETISLADIARAIFARAIWLVFPYGHLGAHAPGDYDDGCRVRLGSRSVTSDRQGPLAKRSGRTTVARASCNILLVSLAVCAAVLRRMGFGRWVRKR